MYVGGRWRPYKVTGNEWAEALVLFTLVQVIMPAMKYAPGVHILGSCCS